MAAGGPSPGRKGAAMNLPDRLLALVSDRLLALTSERLAALCRAGPRRAGWAVLLLVSACQAQTVAPAGPPSLPLSLPAGLAAADEAALLARLRQEIGDAPCSVDTQCRSLAVGHKACGGPQQWWAWSTTTARNERLQAWADELAALQKQRDEASGRVSNCQYVADPGAVCQTRRCVLRSSAAASAR